MQTFELRLEIAPDANGSISAAVEKALTAMQNALDKAGLDANIELEGDIEDDTLSITPWSHGGGPEDFGWVFDGGISLSAYDVAECADREQAEGRGIPDDVLDAFEGDNPPDEYGRELADWLQAGW